MQHLDLSDDKADALAGNVDICTRLLECDVKDDTVTRVMDDIAQSIRHLERRFEEASKKSDQDDQWFWDGENDYLEKLIGVSFIVLQSKIRRVASSAASFDKRLKKFFDLSIAGFETQSAVRALGDTYKGTGSTLVQQIWDTANYFKHRDEWPSEVWEEDNDRKGEANQIMNSRNTRKSVARIGIEKSSTGNMRTAYEFMGAVPYSNCECLVERVQEWADLVYAHSKAGLPVDPEILDRARVRRYARYFKYRNTRRSE